MSEFDIKLEKLTAKVGFGLAICILWGEFPKHYLKGLTFDQWLEIYNAAPCDTAMKEKSLEMMGKLVDTL